ncbi:MAG TPA: hypothetical protein VMX17_05065 [Candidatus Glassbacteria bacterium]|nr:hypothetical protein [Candidatus Glassbacteria bacterium]
MMHRLSQLFCKHIWKEICEDEYLRTEKKPSGRFWFTYEYRLKKLRCVKCRRTKSKEIRYLAI